MTTTSDRQPPEIIEFPTSQPEGQALASIDVGNALDSVLTWSIQTLNLGPTRSSPKYDQHLRDTVGSSYDWSDELRFDHRTGRLASFILKTPETELTDLAVATSWLALPRAAGVPVLQDRDHGFHVDPLDLRYLSDDAGALLVVEGTMLPADGNSLRLAIGPDADLLFQHGRYVGWVLLHPASHLVASPGDVPDRTDDPQINNLLREYLSLVVDPNIAKMSDEDQEVKVALESLSRRARQIRGPKAGALGHAIERVLEAFYPG